jgi:hypothetical protein
VKVWFVLYVEKTSAKHPHLLHYRLLSHYRLLTHYRLTPHTVGVSLADPLYHHTNGNDTATTTTTKRKNAWNIYLGHYNMVLDESEFKRNPDLVIRNWLKTEHDIVIKQYDERPWDLMSDKPGEFRLTAWNVPGVSRPAFTEVMETDKTLEEMEDDDDLTDVHIGNHDTILKFLLQKMYAIDNPDENNIKPTNKKMRQYIATQLVSPTTPPSSTPGPREK